MGVKSKCWGNEKLLRSTVSSSMSVSESLRKLGQKVYSGNYQTFWRYMEIYGIDTSHFDEHAYIRSGKIPNGERPLSEIMVKNSTHSSMSSLKKRLIQNGMLENKCQICGIDPVWNGADLVLHMDHINGDRADNRIENLRLLCPNCHSQTHTYCRGNKRQDTLAQKVSVVGT